MSRWHSLPQLTTALGLLLGLVILSSGTGVEAHPPARLSTGGAQLSGQPPGDRKTDIRPARQNEGRTVRLTLLPDYEQNTVEVIGQVSPGTISAQAAALSDWGLPGSLQPHQFDEQDWHLSGPLPGAHLDSVGKNGRYHLSFGPLSLAPGDSLALTIPFANIAWQMVDPPPDNLAQLTGPAQPLLPWLRYEAGDTGRTLELNLPFTPIRKEIDLTLTPLVGERLTGRADSFRLSGQVTFEGIEDFAAFERYCQRAPNSPFFRYRVAGLLFALDYPPAFHFGFLSPIYQFKPTYTLLRSDLLTCTLEAEAGQVQAQFQGRIFKVPADQGQFPAVLSQEDVLETHQPYTGFGAAAGEYELRLGEIVLAPGDLLRVTVPQTTIRGVTPAPSRFVYDRASNQTHIEYHGPQRLALSLRYIPEPLLLLRQAPASARAVLAPVETWLGPLFGGSAAPVQRIWVWGMLLVGSTLAVSTVRRGSRLQTLRGFAAWFLLSVALLYGLRGVFGWLLLAVAWYLFSPGSGRSRPLRAGLSLILVLVAVLADARSERLFAVLSSIELELTPLTPLILTLLSTALYAGLTRGKAGRLHPFDPAHLPAMLFFLFTLSIYDVLQKSLPALLLTAGGAAFVAYRRSRQSADPEPSAGPELQARFGLVFRSWLVPGGVLLFTILAMQHDLRQTAAIFGPGLGLWGPVLIPVLLFISVLLALSAIALLFVGLYPVLPFRAGYLKAGVLGLFLLAVFVLGVGSDDRLVNVLDTLLAGRLIYYLSMPLLLGLYFDIDRFRRETNAERSPNDDGQEPLSFEKATGLYLKQVRGLIGTVTGILSLVAPSVYAFFFNQPIVTTYFDLLELLISLSVGGF